MNDDEKINKDCNDNQANNDDIMSSAEKELIEKESEKYAARRSSLLEADKLGMLRRLSSASNDTEVGMARHQSFLETGKCQE